MAAPPSSGQARSIEGPAAEGNSRYHRHRPPSAHGAGRGLCGGGNGCGTLCQTIVRSILVGGCHGGIYCHRRSSQRQGEASKGPLVRRPKTPLSQHDTGSAPGSSGQYGNPPSQVKLVHAFSTHLVAWAEVSWTARRALPPRGGRDRSIELAAAVNTASLGRAGVDAAWHRRSPVIEGRYNECISVSRVRGFDEWRPQALPKGSTDRSIDRSLLRRLRPR